MDHITESLDSKLERLLRMGLADRKRLDFYRRVLSNPKQNVNNAEYRPVIVDVLTKLINNTTKDSAIYSKTQQNIQAGRYINEAKNKIKKKNVIPPTARNEPMTWHPETSDVTQMVKETRMQKLQTLKEVIAARNIDEAAPIRRSGTNYRRQTTGSVAGRTGKVRKGTRQARASSQSNTDRLLLGARRRIADAQSKLAKRNQHRLQVDRQEQDIKQKEVMAQHMLRSVY